MKEVCSGLGSAVDVVGVAVVVNQRACAVRSSGDRLGDRIRRDPQRTNRKEKSNPGGVFHSKCGEGGGDRTDPKYYFDDFSSRNQV